MKIQILHNPRCSKSRQALQLIEDRGVIPEIIDYLNGSLSEDFLKKILKALNLPLNEVLRTKEDIFKNLQLNLDDEETVIKAILKHPVILERPIVIKGAKAIIGRPPENVLSLL